jgi:hypothetical protein
MLGKLAEDIAIDLCSSFGNVNRHFNLLRESPAWRRRQRD